jgi:hypothetical protein
MWPSYGPAKSRRWWLNCRTMVDVCLTSPGTSSRIRLLRRFRVLARSAGERSVTQLAAATAHWYGGSSGCLFDWEAMRALDGLGPRRSGGSRPHCDHMRVRSDRYRSVASGGEKHANTGCSVLIGGTQSDRTRVHTAEVSGSIPLAPTPKSRTAAEFSWRHETRPQLRPRVRVRAWI